MASHIEIKHLRMVQSIAETGNMTRAAEKLYISQSALSQQLKDVESRLQVDLFYRTPKKMILTPSGRKLLETAEQVIDMLGNTELEIAKLVEGDSGVLKVGTHCIFCFKWLPGVVAAFRDRFPNVELEIGTSRDPLPELEQEKYDIVISAQSYTERNLERQALFTDQLVCIMEKEHPLAAREYLRLEDFQDINVISHAEKVESKFYGLLLQPKSIEPSRFMTVGQPQAIIELVKSGLGVSIFPYWAVTSAVHAGDLIAKPIGRKGLPVTWSALHVQANNILAYHREFVRMMQKMDVVTHLLEY